MTSIRINYNLTNGDQDSLNWISYTPFFGVSVIGNGSIVGKYRIIGDTMDLRVRVTMGSTTDLSTTKLLFYPPDGYEVDETKLSNNSAVKPIGVAYASQVATATTYVKGFPTTENGSIVIYDENGAYWKDDNPFAFGDGDALEFTASIPVVKVTVNDAKSILGDALLANFDSSDANSVILNGSKVIDWVDKTNSYKVSQSTDGNRPTYVEEGINNLNAIQFTRASTTNLVGTGSPLGAHPGGYVNKHVWVVFRSDDATTIQWPVAFRDTSETANAEYAGVPLVGTVSGDPVRWQIRCYPTPTAIALPESVNGYTAGQVHIVRGWSTATNSHNVSLDGATAANSTTTVTWNATPSVIQFGDFTGITNPFDGYLCEVIVALNPSAAQVTAVNNALMSKWGI